MSDLTAWTVWAVKNKQSGLADLLAQVADDFAVERALADDLAADLIKTRARLGRGQESEALTRWRKARQQ